MWSGCCHTMGQLFLCQGNHSLSQATLVLAPFAMKGDVFKVQLNHSCLGHCSSSSCLFPNLPQAPARLGATLLWLPILCLGPRVCSRALACMSLHAYMRVRTHPQLSGVPKAWSLVPHLFSHPYI